jgi:hypothetical protein
MWPDNEETLLRHCSTVVIPRVDPMTLSDLVVQNLPLDATEKSACGRTLHGHCSDFESQIVVSHQTHHGGSGE